jgi:hypothetical protein
MFFSGQLAVTIFLYNEFNNATWLYSLFHKRDALVSYLSIFIVLCFVFLTDIHC